MTSLLIAEEHLQRRLEPGREAARPAAGLPETRPRSPSGSPVTAAAPRPRAGNHRRSGTGFQPGAGVLPGTKAGRGGGGGRGPRGGRRTRRAGHGGERGRESEHEERGPKPPSGERGGRRALGGRTGRAGRCAGAGGAARRTMGRAGRGRAQVPGGAGRRGGAGVWSAAARGGPPAGQPRRGVCCAASRARSRALPRRPAAAPSKSVRPSVLPPSLPPPPPPGAAELAAAAPSPRLPSPGAEPGCRALRGAARGGSRLPPIVCGAPRLGGGGALGVRWGRAGPGPRWGGRERRHGCFRGCFREPRAEGLPRVRPAPAAGGTCLSGGHSGRFGARGWRCR